MTTYKQHQTGIVMIISLVILLLLTIIAVTALKVTMLEERMAGNLQNQNIAFQAAESALREAEAFINGQIITADSDFNPLRLSNGPFQNTTDPICVSGLCGTPSPLLESLQLPDDFTDTRVATTNIPDTTISQEPEYIIELIGVEYIGGFGEEYRSAMFRITARAWGGDANSRTQLQSTYRAVVKFIN